jgi:hypothetical protein
MPKEQWYSIGKDTNPVESKHAANNQEGIHLTVIEAVQLYVSFPFPVLWCTNAAISNRQRQLGIQASDEVKIASGVLRVPNHGALLNTCNNQRRAKRMARYHKDRRSAKEDLIHLMLDSEDLKAELSAMGQKSELSDDDRLLYDALYAEQREIEGRMRWIRQQNRSLRVLSSELTKARREHKVEEKENDSPLSPPLDARTTVVASLAPKEWESDVDGGEGDIYSPDASMDFSGPSADKIVLFGGPSPRPIIPLDPRLCSSSPPPLRPHTPQTSTPPLVEASPCTSNPGGPSHLSPARFRTPPASNLPLAEASPHALHPAGPPQPHNNWAGLHPPMPGAPYDTHPLGPPQAIGLALPTLPVHGIEEPLPEDNSQPLNCKKRSRPPKGSGEPVKQARMSVETPTDTAQPEVTSTTKGPTKMGTVGTHQRKEPARLPQVLTTGKSKKTSTKNVK